MRRKFNQKGGVLALLLVGAVGGALYYGVHCVVTGSNSAILGLLRQIAISIDTKVYSVSSWAYSIFYEVSSSSLLSSLNLASASQRLYTLLGIFMLFRLAFAFIKYIINPDGMDKGSGKLLTNLAISLALIVSVPWIFNRAFALQTYIMDSNVIGNLIMGMNNDKSSNNDSFNAASYGQAISFLTFNAFYSPNASIPDISSCGNLLYYYSDNLQISANGTTLDEENGANGQKLNKEDSKIAKCVNALNDIEASDVKTEDGSTELGTMFYIASQRYSISLLSSPNVYRARYGNQYIINYTSIISTIAGGFLALLFLNFCFDVAIRNVKLCFLQIIAPIPIILNIEPGDSKGDRKSLNWWVKESLKTYVDLFIRVATVYFGVFLINIIFGEGNSAVGSQNTSVWFQVFMILGILLFVKQIPEMIGKAFGIDVKGQFSLNPLKRIGENRLSSLALGGAAGLATGLLGGGIAAYRGARSAGAGRGEAFRRAITGGAGAAAHGMTGGARKGAKSIHDVISNTRETMARSGRVAASNVGTTWTGRTSASAAMAMGTPTSADIDKNVIDTTSGLKKGVDALYARAGGEMMKKNGTEVSFSAATSRSIRDFYNKSGTGDALFGKNANGDATFQLYDAATGSYRESKSINADYSIGDYKTELAAYNSAKEADTSGMSVVQKQTYAARIAEWERGLNLKKKFIEGQAAAEWMVQKDASGNYHDEISGHMAEQLVSNINRNLGIYGKEDIMGAGNTFGTIDTRSNDYLEAFVGEKSKKYADRADIVSKSYGGSDTARRHEREKAAAQARHGK